ncbi:hypothetical protein [Burkholderia gladioli]|uniref:hypothetical protein n=1 Tax=Burkholderia gladioli TaxID=28095 RepID=UPI0021B37C17|nr:hypothetical protein [Burkholderia gladioli]
MNVADARHALAELAANPSTNKAWLDGVANAMASLQGDDAPETGKAVDALADGIVTAAAQVSDPGLAHQTLDLVEVGLRYAPHSPGLAEQRDRMLMLLQQQRIDQQIASSDPAAQVDALRLAASANDGPRALAALNRLRSLQPGSAVLASAAPQLVASAYLGNARVLARRGRLADAARWSRKAPTRCRATRGSARPRSATWWRRRSSTRAASRSPIPTTRTCMRATRRPCRPMRPACSSSNAISVRAPRCRRAAWARCWSRSARRAARPPMPSRRWWAAAAAAVAERARWRANR